jgi:sulfite exporter TauE/SafE
MIELPLVFLGGLLGSAHCLGMCGGFAVLIGGAAPRWSQNLSRQLLYSLGRIFSYAALGAMVGYGGLRLHAQLSPLINVQAAIAIVAGVLLIVQGAIASGIFQRLRGIWHFHRGNLPAKDSGSGVGCLLGGLVGTFLRDPRRSHVFLAGVFTGLLPCGLVYAFVTLAASTSNPWQAMAIMAAFGTGTVPMMVLAGCGSSLLSFQGRRRLMTAAAWCVMAMGAISLVRGVSFIHAHDAPVAQSCPLCQ